MKVSVYGVGYVGLVTGVCLAKLGHEVYCYDIDSNKIKQLNDGISPIYEEGLEALLNEALQNRSITFSDAFDSVAQNAQLHIIAVGTPPKSDGSADLSNVLSVIERLSTCMASEAVIVNKSTVPVGTADQVYQLLNGKFDVVSNPEFLKEGKAIEDFMKPERIIVGSENERAANLMRELYAPLVDQGIPFIVMGTRSAELTKYAANAFLATKISFMNEMSQLAERMGADINQVKRGIGSDSRIGSQFLNAGCGYGGSCFPKDVSALIAMADDLSYQASILKAVQHTNERQQLILFEKLLRYFNNDLSGRRIALWGLAFKPGTDDIRCAPSLVLIERLWEAGASIQAYDPMAMGNVRQHFGDDTRLQLCVTPEDAIKNAHALAIVTEWPSFLDPDFAEIKSALHQPVIFDGRNLYDPKKVAQFGLQYCAIGRGIPFYERKTTVCD